MKKDPIIDQLRAQARSFDPQPPPGLQRRTASAIASIERATLKPSASGLQWVARVSAAAAVIALMLLIISVFRQPRPAMPIIVRNEPPVSRPAAIASPSLASANPISLTHRWIERPLAGEYDRLLTGLTRTKDTVIRILPAAKRSTPAPQDGA